MQARDRAREANKGIEIKYMRAQGRLDTVVRHAGHPEGCARSGQRLCVHELHHGLRKVIADISNFKRYANANAAAQSLVLPSVKDDPAIYPPPELRQKLAVQLADSPDQTRAITRVWQKFKTGQ